MEFAEHLWRIVNDRFGHVVAVIIVSIAGVLGWALLQYALRLSRQAWCFVRSRHRTLKAVAREYTKDGPREGAGVWLTKPIHQPDDYENRVAASKILAIANLKGGVGKTTLAANIGAYLAKDWSKRVLLIDLDFQGSLSSMAFPRGDWLPSHRQNSIATKLISNDLTPDLVERVASQVHLNDDNSTGRLKIIPAYYDLAQADNRIMVEWLLRCRHQTPNTLRESFAELLRGKLFRAADVRYTLAEILHSDAIRSAFDLIIIDCPPRLTSSEIQAFCASSHLLIPTIFDRTSAEAVGSLCEQIETLKSANICPYLKYIGVVGTMWQADRIAQRDAKTLVQDALNSAGIATGLLPESTFVPRAAALVNDAGEGIAYIAMPDHQSRQQVRMAIKSLATYIAGQMGIPAPPQFQQTA